MCDRDVDTTAEHGPNLVYRTDGSTPKWLLGWENREYISLESL